MKLEWTETGKIKHCVFNEEAVSFRQDDYGGPAWQCRLGEELRTSTAPRYREGWFKEAFFGVEPVSYTHLDVYKRQALDRLWCTSHESGRALRLADPSASA